ncbi:zinc-binding protein [Corynebacterium aquilae DSM 44791]|uniref:Zinc-binding protein n=1 Tax=Corynebacterium aquilae DSM 44791 TaxID=1431546 RepID=A0A1L7CFR5_9CORY|nr:zinc-binding protein [Corynebacterium aquilae DSM 44791]
MLNAAGFPVVGDSDKCPCTSGDTYGQCCGRFHCGSSVAPTAEALMRSRFSAFVVGNSDYLLSTWLGETAPETLHLDPSVVFYRLDIHSTTAGGPFDDRGSVDFEAFYRVGEHRGSQREHSQFAKAAGRWFYIGEA